MLLAEVVKFHVHEGVAGTSPSGRTVVDPIKLKPISRLGGNTCAPAPARTGPKPGCQRLHPPSHWALDAGTE